jgi:hypothetical protein
LSQIDSAVRDGAIRASPAIAHVHIEGGGVAALCCARLLRDAGLRVSGRRASRRAVPVVMLGRAAQALIRDVFGPEDLLGEQPAVRRRVVCWGDGEPVVLPHSAMIVSEARLFRALEGRPTPEGDEAADFVIRTAAPHPSLAARAFGSRQGLTAPVRLRNAADADCCFMEATATGWLFVVPGGGHDAWLLGVGAPLDELLAQSRLVAPLIELSGSPSQPFDMTPRLADPVCGPGWLAAGSASIAFDPICGDGTAQAIRQAVLASATIVALAQGGSSAALLGHYRAMLTATMRRHLTLSHQYYATGGASAWWRDQVEALQQGHALCTSRLAAAPAPAFALAGSRLVPRAVAA